MQHGLLFRAQRRQALIDAGWIIMHVTLGGALGVVCGWGVTRLLGTLPLLGPLFEDTTGTGDIHLRISTFAVLTSTIMLETVGLIAGLLPAIKAARLDPIDALRYE